MSVENFGPVRSGSFELRPLTIFIGPNNSGKSYVAQLVYAVIGALAVSAHDAALANLYPKLLLSDEDSERVTLYLEQAAGARGAAPLDLGVLPASLQEVVRRAVERAAQTILGEILQSDLEDYFACEGIRELIRLSPTGAAREASFAIRRAHGPLLNARIEPDRPGPEVECEVPDLADAPLAGSAALEAVRTGDTDELLWLIWTEMVGRAGISRASYYLPGRRAGIIDALPVIASAAMEMLRRRIKLDRAGAPRLSGITGDFLERLFGLLLEDQRSGPTEAPLRDALEFLERAILVGDVSITDAKADRSTLRYQSGPVSMSVHRASSMVSEVAPLALWIKHLLEPGDLLVIDEPEAHLHPENQRRIARVLVRLVRAGVRVLCTTHSSLIVHQVSNHLLAAGLSAEERAAQGFTGADFLKREEVGVYLFQPGRDGVSIKSVPVQAGFGISEDEFLRVAEAIGDETYRLTASATGDDGSA